MLGLEFIINGERYLKMLEITWGNEHIQLASTTDSSWEIKFFRIINDNDRIDYQEVDGNLLEELKKIYSPKASEIIL